MSYALPWPPDADPPDPMPGEGQPSLWMASCGRCGGAGAIRLDDLAAGGAPDDWVGCPTCGGSGLAGETLARRPLP